MAGYGVPNTRNCSCADTSDDEYGGILGTSRKKQRLTMLKIDLSGKRGDRVREILNPAVTLRIKAWDMKRANPDVPRVCTSDHLPSPLVYPLDDMGIEVFAAFRDADHAHGRSSRTPAYAASDSVIYVDKPLYYVENKKRLSGKEAGTWYTIAHLRSPLKEKVGKLSLRSLQDVLYAFYCAAPSSREALPARGR